MAVKFPLEVKNGVKARNISELKENFDIEKVIGYFLDGKLKNWLDARYYEEEAEAIGQLDENDEILAKKLCEIFDVEYEMEEINHEEIARRNERLAKLKQFTTDYEIINNIDVVAFDQEELAELYDIGVKKIYLCEGNFVIPKSKRELEYVLVSNPEVIGLNVEKEEDTKEYFSSEKIYRIYDIPVNIADKINVSHYVETEDYIVYRDGFDICKFSKTDNSISEITIPEKYQYMIGDEYFAAYGNHVIFAPYNQYAGTLLNYDLNQNKCSQVIIYDSWPGGLKEHFVDDGKLAYFKNEDVKVYDLKTDKDEFCFEYRYMSDINYVLFDSKLYIFEKGYYELQNGEYGGFTGNLYYLDINEHMKKVEILNYKDKECNCREAKFHVSNDELYLILHQESLEGKTERLGFKILRINDSTVDTLIDLNGQNIGFRRELLKNCKYIPFVKLDESHSLNLFDLEQNEVIEIASECGFRGRHYKEYREFCNSHQIVGNFLYYEKGEKKRLYQVDLRTGREMPIK